MLKAMISQPMNGLTEEQIRSTRDRAVKELRAHGYEVIDSFFCDEWKQKPGEDVVNVPLAFMAKGTEVMSKCHAVYFCTGWKNSRGCRIENRLAMDYGLNCLYEESERW